MLKSASSTKVSALRSAGQPAGMAGSEQRSRSARRPAKRTKSGVIDDGVVIEIARTGGGDADSNRGAGALAGLEKTMV